MLQPNTNFGTSMTVQVDPSILTTARGLFRFDVSQIPLGSAVESAVLRLCQATGNQPGEGRTHQLRRLMSTWTELGVTWNNQPPVNAAASAGFQVIDVAQCAYTDVSQDVQSWVNGANNYGWQVNDRDETLLTGTVEYASREHSSISHRPQLVVTYRLPSTITYYLHENPYPPLGDSTSAATLPMSGSAPSATTLYNYDTDMDSGPGIVIERGGSGAGETDADRYQSWIGPAAAAAFTIDGSVSLSVWSAVREFEEDKAATLAAYLRDCSGSACTLVGSATHSDADWQDGYTGWRPAGLTITTGTYTLAPGHWLELKLIVPNSSEDDLWFAYDTTTYDSHIRIPIAQP